MTDPITRIADVTIHATTEVTTVQWEYGLTWLLEKSYPEGPGVQA